MNGIQNEPMLEQGLCCVCAWLSLLLFGITGATAHSLEEVQQVFEQEPISPELVELTKELEMTAGMKSLREQVHAQQHQILEQYVRARTTRKCADSMLMLPRLDQEIARSQEQGQITEEQKLREMRDTTAAFITKTCASTE